MEVLRAEVPLPRSEDELLDKICFDQSQPPPDAEVRRRLALRGEEGAMEILCKVAATKIKKSLSGLIIYFLEESSPPSSSSKSPCLSDSPITSGPAFPIMRSSFGTWLLPRVVVETPIDLICFR